MGSPIQRLRHIGIADDGAGNELGEQGNIGAEGDEIFLRRHRAPVHVHGVAQALEGVEADAHGQGQLQKRQAQAGDGIDAGDEKVRVFEKSQQSHAHGNGQGQPRLFMVLAAPDGKAAQVEYHDSENHQEQQLRLPPTVERKACKKQHGVFPPPGSEEVHRQHRRQEIVQEGNAGKDHNGFLKFRRAHLASPKRGVTFLSKMAAALPLPSPFILIFNRKL